MKPVSDNRRVRKVSARDTAIGFRQVHHHYLNPLTPLQTAQIAAQARLRASQPDIKHFVVSQVSKGRGIALFGGKKVFINTQNSWAKAAIALRGFLSNMVLVPAFNGG